ncbi:MAG: low temperature requirement protein A [Acidimicrobiia bacterium]|nr:low temperature requirement protein A [Acidimicrobiia bacterium]NNC76163.1 low temperature requirement protein A [Acidimicrobiia bacterium]
MKLSAVRPPRLRTTETEAGDERSATWMELFYDLVFVVAVAALAKRLLADPGWGGVLAFTGLFVPIWWSWASYTFYADRYDTDDAIQRVLVIVQIAAIALMAASISGDTADSSVGFALSYVLARLVLLVMYVRAQRHVVETRELVSGYLKGFSAGGLVWLVSVFVPEPARFWMWGVALLIEFATPYAVRKLQARSPLSVSHLPERFGLFTILVLGESIAAVVAGLAHEGWVGQSVAAALLGVFLASGLWWLYFDNAEGSVVRRDPKTAKAWRPTVWIFTHLPLSGALVASGIGLEFMVALHAGTVERFVVAGGTAGALAFMGVLHIATEPSPERRDSTKAMVRFGAALVALLLGAVIGENAVALVVALLVLIVGQILLDLLILDHALPTEMPSDPVEAADSDEQAEPVDTSEG